MESAWFIRGGRVVDPFRGRDETADLYVRGGRLAPPAEAAAQTPAIDARGLVVAPGLLDLHVHFREPGDESAETIASGSAAAARGGFCGVVTMPNTRPPVDTAEAVARMARGADRTGLVRVYPAGCITRGRGGREPADLAAMSRAGAAAFTDDGSMVASAAAMEQAMRKARELDRPILDHALDSELACNGVMHEGARSAELGLPGIPAAAETAAVRRDIELARRTGCRLHIQHLSTAEGVELIARARAAGLAVTGEATPHHLLLSEADVDGRDADYKMNPPLRTERDREALRAGIADGTLSVLATDHAPHGAERKREGMLRAPFGVIGLETAVGVTYTVLVRDGGMDLRDWLARWTAGPAAVLGLPARGLVPGSPADITILDLATPWTVRRDRFASRSRNTPFEGRRLVGRARYTFRGGRLTASASEGN